MANVFVFGSNLAGRHGKGAALHAFKKHGAKYGRGSGRYGDSYAIPTRDWHIHTLPLWVIANYINMFMAHVAEHPEDTFNITRIGCGLAGYDWERDIRPLFPAMMPDNCVFVEG